MRRSFFPLLLAACLCAPAFAQSPSVRPEVGKPLQAAVDLLKARRAKEALAKAREAQAQPDKTPYESYLVSRVVGQAAAAAGDPAAAARALEGAAASPAAPPADRQPLLAAAAAQYYALKEYAKAADVATRYFQSGGTDRAVRTIYIQSLYLGGKPADAARELARDIDARVPKEEELQLLANAYLQAKDGENYRRAVERLLTHYPKREYWATAIHNVVTQPGYQDRLALDVFRLKLETGTLRTTGEYLDYAQMALIEHRPAEAKRVIDKGYAAGFLGVGAESQRHRRLRELAAKTLADGDEKRRDPSKLELGYAYYIAGQKEKALQLFKSVEGAHSAAALARLWVIRLKMPRE